MVVSDEQVHVLGRKNIMTVEVVFSALCLANCCSLSNSTLEQGSKG